MRTISFLRLSRSPHLQCGLRGGVVGMARLAEAAGGRADEDKIAVAGALDLAHENASTSGTRREVRTERRLPAFERELPDRLVRARPHSGTPRRRRRRRALHATPRRTTRLRLVGEIGADRDRAGELGHECLRPLPPGVKCTTRAPSARTCERLPERSRPTRPSRRRLCREPRVHQLPRSTRTARRIEEARVAELAVRSLYV